MTRIARLAALAFALSGLAGACVYRMDIQQGNYLDPNSVAQLQNGMTRSQVRFLLGTPMLPEAFDQSRWDYFYYMKRGRIREPEKRRVTVWFEEDKVARIDRVNVIAPVFVPTTPAPTAPAPENDTERVPAPAPAPAQTVPPTADSAG